MEVKPALCPAHRSLLPDGKQLILHSSTALSQSLPCLFLDRGLSTPPPSLPSSLHSPFPGSISQKFGNAFPTAWELSRGIVFADIVFARPADQVQPPSRNGIPQSGYSARTMLGIEAKIDESVSYPGAS